MAATSRLNAQLEMTLGPLYVVSVDDDVSGPLTNRPVRSYRSPPHSLEDAQTLATLMLDRAETVTGEGVWRRPVPGGRRRVTITLAHGSLDTDTCARHPLDTDARSASVTLRPFVSDSAKACRPRERAHSQALHRAALRKALRCVDSAPQRLVARAASSLRRAAATGPCSVIIRRHAASSRSRVPSRPRRSRTSSAAARYGARAARNSVSAVAIAARRRAAPPRILASCSALGAGRGTGVSPPGRSAARVTRPHGQAGRPPGLVRPQAA